MSDWLHIERSESPLILAFPHGGTDLAGVRGFDDARARIDTDWYIRDLYKGLADATLVATDISRSVIDCNRDPSGASLYPGQATTGLCPVETFDGDVLYRPGCKPDEAEVAHRRQTWFEPYHAALAAEIARLRARHPRVVVYDCHSIRSVVPRLFDGDLPELNIGTNGAATCDPDLERAVVLAAAQTGRSMVVNGRFRGGWTTRHHGAPEAGVHAIQMELALRAYLREPDLREDDTLSGRWPPAWDPEFAAPLRADLARILEAALHFAKDRS